MKLAAIRYALRSCTWDREKETIMIGIGEYIEPLKTIHVSGFLRGVSVAAIVSKLQ